MQIYSFQLNDQKPLSFNAAGSINNKQVKILKSLEDTFTKTNKKPDNIKNLYKNSISYMKGNLEKDEYLSKLNSNLKEIYKNNEVIKLNEKEEKFFDNMFLTFDFAESHKNITKEQIMKALSILTNKN